jgi:hypothetical protein
LVYGTADVEIPDFRKNNVSSNFFQNMLSALADDRLEQATSSAPIFSKIKVWMGKYLKKSCSF